MSEDDFSCPSGSNAQPRAIVPTRFLGARTVGLFLLSVCLVGCAKKPDANTLVMIIESSPTNLDPRVGLDAQSERIDGLLFDDLFTRDEHLNVQPGLVERWEMPDPLTYVFHLRSGVRFHNGQFLTSRDVKWTFDSLLQGKILSTKAAAYRFVDHIEAMDPSTIIFHLKEPDAPLLWNLSDGAIGIVPYGSGNEISSHPIGSGPFRFVSAEQDKNVIIERNDDYWAQKARLQRVRFDVVPDATTRALELRKGSADIAFNALTGDMVVTLEKEPRLKIMHTSGTRVAYIGFNLRDPILKDRRVRQAVAKAIDRKAIIHYLLRDFARPASNLLPTESWAFSEVPAYSFDPHAARQLLDAAGYSLSNGIRFHLTMKTSTEESTRLLAAVLQQQLRDVGIALDIRTFESATFFSDVTRGAFQFYSMTWAGGTEDPDI
ncbi:MAG TPA: ABC transporter substrate-binding protein, partial [Terriglobales bacterium]|nr:ABC transporter substrate-binding protein [Terriglobales bacterium]